MSVIINRSKIALIRDLLQTILFYKYCFPLMLQTVILKCRSVTCHILDTRRESYGHLNLVQETINCNETNLLYAFNYNHRFICNFGQTVVIFHFINLPSTETKDILTLSLNQKFCIYLQICIKAAMMKLVTWILYGQSMIIFFQKYSYKVVIYHHYNKTDHNICFEIPRVNITFLLRQINRIQ